jgi:hypothetical protein
MTEERKPTSACYILSLVPHHVWPTLGKTDFIWAGKHGSIGVALQPNGHSEWTRLSFTDDLGPILIPIIMQSRLPVECRA